MEDRCHLEQQTECSKRFEVCSRWGLKRITDGSYLLQIDLLQILHQLSLSECVLLPQVIEQLRVRWWAVFRCELRVNLSCAVINENLIVSLTALRLQFHRHRLLLLYSVHFVAAGPWPVAHTAPSWRKDPAVRARLVIKRDRLVELSAYFKLVHLWFRRVVSLSSTWWHHWALSVVLWLW